MPYFSVLQELTSHKRFFLAFLDGVMSRLTDYCASFTVSCWLLYNQRTFEVFTFSRRCSRDGSHTLDTQGPVHTNCGRFALKPVSPGNLKTVFSGNPKTLTPGPRTAYGPVHGLPLRTPSTDHPPKYNKNNK